jgi:hypothetical protein
MKIHFQDEYGETLHVADLDLVPRASEIVILKDEEYFVRSVAWAIEKNAVIVEITQNLIKTKEEDKTEGRLKEANSAIVSLTERVEATERRGRILLDGLVRVKNHIRTQDRKNR